MRIPQGPTEVAAFVASEEFAGARKAVQLDERALAIARRVVEDMLVDFRDSGISVFCGNGFVVRQPDGKDSAVTRLSTADGLQIAIRAYLAAAAATEEG